MAIHHETGVIASIEEGSFKASGGREITQLLATIKVYSSRVDGAGQVISQVNAMQVETTNEDVMRRLRTIPTNTFISFDFVISGRSVTRAADGKAWFVNSIRLLNFHELRLPANDEGNSGADAEG